MNISDVIAWFLNVSSSVIIVFVNKVLLDAKAHGFVFGELCCQSAGAEFRVKAHLHAGSSTCGCFLCSHNPLWPALHGMCCQHLGS